MSEERLAMSVTIPGGDALPSDAELFNAQQAAWKDTEMPDVEHTGFERPQTIGGPSIDEPTPLHQDFQWAYYLEELERSEQFDLEEHENPLLNEPRTPLSQRSLTRLEFFNRVGVDFDALPDKLQRRAEDRKRRACQSMRDSGMALGPQHLHWMHPGYFLTPWDLFTFPERVDIGPVKSGQLMSIEELELEWPEAFPDDPDPKDISQLPVEHYCPFKEDPGENFQAQERSAEAMRRLGPVNRSKIEQQRAGLLQINITKYVGSTHGKLKAPEPPTFAEELRRIPYRLTLGDRLWLHEEVQEELREEEMKRRQMLEQMLRERAATEAIRLGLTKDQVLESFVTPHFSEPPTPRNP
jgi:hypothetical protein